MSEPKTAQQKFDERYRRLDNGCWEWTKGIHEKGYAVFTPEGKTLRAHRWIWEQQNGPIPDGYDVDHVCHTKDLSCPGGPSCRHRRCVNPEHLEPVEPLENVRRGRRPNGPDSVHVLNHKTGPGSTIVTGGRERCIECFREAEERYRQRRSGALAPRLSPTEAES